MALKEVLVKYTADSSEVTKGLASGEKAAASAESSFAKGAKAIAAFFAASKIKAFAEDIIDTGAKVGLMASRIGISAQAFQRWDAAAQLSGVNTEELSAGIRGLQKNATEAAKNAGSEQAQAFKTLGVSVKDASGKIKPGTDLLRDTGLALAKMPDASKRNALAMKLMEEAGGKLIPIFQGGAESLDGLLGTLGEYGGGYSDDAIKAAKDSKVALVKWDLAVNSAKGRFAETFLPALARGVEWLAKLGASFSRIVGSTSILQSSASVAGAILVAWGIKTAASWGPVALKFTLIALAVVAAVLVIDELITAMRGGKTVLGDWINQQDRLSSSPFERRMQDAKSFGAKVEEILSSVGSVIVQWVVNQAQQFGLFFRFIGEDISSAFTSAKAAIVTKLTEWGAAIWAMLPNWMTAGLSLAGALISGIVTGIVAGAKKVVDSVKGMAKGAIDGAKELLNIKSPSKVFAGIGLNVAAGLAGGIDAGAPGAVDAALGMGAGVVAAASPAGAALSQSVSSTVNVYGVPAASASAVGAAAERGSGLGMGDATRALLAALDSA